VPFMGILASTLSAARQAFNLFMSELVRIYPRFGRIKETPRIYRLKITDSNMRLFEKSVNYLVQEGIFIRSGKTYHPIGRGGCEKF
jgi:hypothetical protein